MDLVESIREEIPPKPNMNNEKIFKFYFQYYNKEYNVEFSRRVMMNLQKLNNSVMNEILGIVEEEKSIKKAINDCFYGFNLLGPLNKN